MKKPHENAVAYFVKNFGIIVGIVLIWRGIWYVLDQLDTLFFNGSHMWTAILGIVIGFLVLYLPDHDLKEIEKL